MHLKFIDQVFRVLFIHVFMLGMIGAPNISAAAQAPTSNPTFNVAANATFRYGRMDWVEGWGWAVGEPVDVAIDDPDTAGLNPDASLNGIAVFGCNQDPTQGCFGANFRGLHDIQAGDVVSVTQGTIVKTHEVLAVEITEIDAEADIVSGRADPFSQVQVGVWPPDGPGGANRTTTADEFGNWSADFTDEVPETEDFDIVGGTYSGASRTDEDGDRTSFGDRAPTPNISASAQFDWIRAREWPSGAEVHFLVNGQDFGSAIMEEPQSLGDSTFASFNLGDYELQTGDLVTVTDGIRERSLVVSPLAITGVDMDTDLVSGVGTPGAQIYASVYHDGSDIWRATRVDDITGTWEVDFSGVVDIQFGSMGSAQERDDDEDATWYEWEIPVPTVSAFPQDDYLNGHNWPLGAPLLIEIDDPTTPANPDYTGQAADWDPNTTSFRMIDFSGQYDMKPGDIVTVTNGTITKTHIVTDFAITEIDISTDIVSGWAEPGSEIVSWICDQEGCASRNALAGQDGIWFANFSVLGNHPWDWGIYDFKLGLGVEASQTDEDGDSTVMGRSVLLDGDGDGINDDIDACPAEDASGYDADQDGCIDTAQGLTALVQSMPEDEVAHNLKKPLLGKVDNAIKSLEKGHSNAAIHQLEAFINQVEAQRGKKISEDAADLLIAYAQNVLEGIQ